MGGSGILPTSVVAWGHWISPSLQHLRGASQAANHIRSWLPAGPNCPTPPQEPAFQDWISHTTQVRATADQIEAQRLDRPTQSWARHMDGRTDVLLQSHFLSLCRRFLTAYAKEGPTEICFLLQATPAVGHPQVT